MLGCIGILDKSGQLPGYFIPAEDKSLYKTDFEPPPWSAEELEFAKNGPGRSLDEILRDLENRPWPPQSSEPQSLSRYWPKHGLMRRIENV